MNAAVEKKTSFVWNALQTHWLGAYSTYGLYSEPIFVRFNDLEGVFAWIVLSFGDILLFGFKPLGKSVLLITVFGDC